MIFVARTKMNTDSGTRALASAVFCPKTEILNSERIVQ